MNILKSGDRFTAKTKLGNEYEYEFVGIDLRDAGVGLGGTGCHYIVLRNITDGTMTCVERAWFSEDLTGRKIRRLEDENGT